MYFVGIDISKFKHDCVVIDEIGDIILPSWSFNNDCEGFSLLWERLRSLGDDVRTGLEATGHYEQNLKLFLEANGFTFMEFNPLLVSRLVGSKTLRNTSDFLLHQMSVPLELYSQLDSKVDELEQQIEEYICGIDPPILSIPGIGALSAAVILSEYGDFSKFKNPSKMLSFAGQEPGYFQSGQSESAGHMVKHGSSKLRCTPMNCCLPLISNEPVFAEYYAKKRAEGKTHLVAMTHVAEKLLRVVYALQIKNIPYDPTLIR